MSTDNKVGSLLTPVLIPVGKIIPAKYNPANRTEKSKLAALKKSMEDIGILYPIIVDHNYRIIDGHRRLAVAKELRWESIPAFVRLCENPDYLYASVNVTAKKMSGNDAMSVWLKRPGAVEPRLKVRLAYMQDVLGRDIMEQACSDGYSYGTFDIALRIGRYCDNKSPMFLRQAFIWMINYSSSVQVKRAIDTGLPIRKFLYAINHNKPIVTTVTVEE